MTSATSHADGASWRSLGNWAIDGGRLRRTAKFVRGTPPDVRQTDERGLVLDFLEMLWSSP